MWNTMLLGWAHVVLYYSCLQHYSWAYQSTNNVTLADTQKMVMWSIAATRCVSCVCIML